MINFIISDNNEDAVKIKELIDNFMMDYDLDVKFHLFNNYEKDFKTKTKLIPGFKVYILNKELNNMGLDGVKYIRKELDDWNSLIIMTINKIESKYEVIGKRLFLFDVICKTIYFERVLKDDLEKIMKNYNNRDKCLTFEANRVIKRIDFKSIDMIVKEKDSKKCVIKASHGNYYTPESLNQVSKRLDKRFVKINRSCIINADEIVEYNLSENKITLKNGMVSYDISRDYKKKVSNYVSNYK